MSSIEFQLLLAAVALQAHRGRMLRLDDVMNEAGMGSFLPLLPSIRSEDFFKPELNHEPASLLEDAEDPRGFRPPPGLSLKQPPELPAGVVTLMVRNIPARYDQDLLLKEWIPDGSFDILHVPFDVELCGSKGYCFVNCVSHEAALDFQRKVHGTRLRFQKGKALNVGAAVVQGREGNLKTFRGRALAHMPYFEMVPAIFEGKDRLSTSDVLKLLGQSKLATKLTRLRSQPPQATYSAELAGM